MRAAIERRSNNGGAAVPFSLAIDATKVPQVLEASQGYKAIVGGEHPNHMIIIKDKTQDQVKLILDGKDPAIGKVTAASEVKVAIMSFQHSPPGISPTEVIAARPQGNNESNDFIKMMEVAAVSVSRTGRGRFVNFSVDGVSVESWHVWSALCEFLSCKANHTGTTDPNHNMKSWRHQLTAGGGCVGKTIGMYVIDIENYSMN